MKSWVTSFVMLILNTYSTASSLQLLAVQGFLDDTPDGFRWNPVAVGNVVNA